MVPVNFSNSLLLYSWCYEKTFGDGRILKSALNEVNFTLSALILRNDRELGCYIRSMSKAKCGISLRNFLFVYP